MISIIIPTNGSPKTTLDSLAKQTYTDFKITVVKDKGKGANWARNKGFKNDTEFVLFSDDDINWYPDALQTLYNTLKANPKKSYSYGAYRMDNWVQCNVEFDAEKLKQNNYISTMSLIRSKDFPGFDENIQRLQDWDLWLNMLSKGKTGVYCGKEIFSTKIKKGISFENKLSYEDAKQIILNKYENNN